MEKQIKIIICADDGEWSRENTDAISAKGAQVMIAGRNGAALPSLWSFLCPASTHWALCTRSKARGLRSPFSL